MKIRRTCVLALLLMAAPAFRARADEAVQRVPACFLSSKVDTGAPLIGRPFGEAERKRTAVALPLWRDEVLLRLRENLVAARGTSARTAAWIAVAETMNSETAGPLATEFIDATDKVLHSKLLKDRTGWTPGFQLFRPATAAKLELTVEQREAIGKALVADWSVKNPEDKRDWRLRVDDWSERRQLLHGAVVKPLTAPQRRLLEQLTGRGDAKHRDFASPLMRSRTDIDKLATLKCGREPLKLDASIDAKIVAAVDQWRFGIAKDGAWLDKDPAATDFDIPDANERAVLADDKLRAALRELLTEEQRKRLKQLMYAAIGVDSEFGVPGAQEPKPGPLGVTDEQRDAAVAKTKEMNEAIKKTGHQGFHPQFLVNTEFGRWEVLTPRQRDKMKELTGEPLADPAGFAFLVRMNMAFSTMPDKWDKQVAWGPAPKK